MVLSAAILLKGAIRTPPGSHIEREDGTEWFLSMLSVSFSSFPFGRSPPSVDAFPWRLTKGGLCKVISAVKKSYHRCSSRCLWGPRHSSPAEVKAGEKKTASKETRCAYKNSKFKKKICFTSVYRLVCRNQKMHVYWLWCVTLNVTLM